MLKYGGDNMCGIVGYVGEENAVPILAEGLKNLEYRGYDSVGIAITDDTVEIYKQTGTISDLDLPDESKSTMGVGHTRWSTHGLPTDVNAHPHVDCTGQVAVVHNGIIENYEPLKEELRERGHEFVSDTDTEVVPHLIEEELEKVDFFEAVRRVVNVLEGSYALAIFVKGREGIIVARSGSPLLIGRGDGENFVASDVTAFLRHTKEVSYLEDGDFAWITRDDVEVYHEGESIHRPITTVDWEADAAEKSGYEHYMLKEIHEQPQSLRQTISGRLDVVNGTVDLDVSLPDEYLRSLEEIQIVAAGTSYHAGLYVQKLLEKHAEVRTTVKVASEYEFNGGRDPWRTLVIAITQSGETADTLAAIRKASKRGAKTLAITNTVGSTVTRESDDTLYIHAGPEISVAATKTFASQVSTLAMFTVYVGRVRETLSSERASEILESVRGLPGAIQQVLDAEHRVKKVAEKYVAGDAFFYIGRNLCHPVALEGALKLKEISYDHAEGFPAGELKHGPLALVTERTPVFSILTTGSNFADTLNNIKEVESRSAPVVAISSNKEIRKHVDDYFETPESGEMEPLVANVYLQLFAYHVANLKGQNIDKPRNLAKSVTVE